MARISTLSLWLAILVSFLSGGLVVRLTSDQTMMNSLFMPPTPPLINPLPPPREPQVSSWHGQPLYLHQNEPLAPSRVQCLAENFHESAWMYRSCRFLNLCLDTENNTFVLYPSKDHIHLNEAHVTNKTYLSSIPNDMISGGQHSGWLKRRRGLWKPEVRTKPPSTYYMLPDNVVWVSFYPWGECNPGHLLWDTFLPVYTLLEMFGWVGLNLFLTEMPSDKGHCAELMMEYIKLMTDKGVPSEIPKLDKLPHIVCTKHALNGMGWLTDHGLGNHGSSPRDLATPRNVGRAANLAGFRRYLLKKLGATDLPILADKVVFSILSSRAANRRFDFADQVQAVKTALPHAQVETVALWNYTFAQQVELALSTKIWISVAGGGTSSAWFLPQGASLIIYYTDRDYFDFGIWNNFAHLRVHWLSLGEENVDLLVDLLRDQLDSFQDFAGA